MARISVEFEVKLTDETQALVFEDGSIRLVTTGARFIVEDITNFRDEPSHASVTVRRVQTRKAG